MKIKSSYIANTHLSNDEILDLFQNTSNARFNSYRGDMFGTVRFNASVKMEIEQVSDNEYNCFSNLGVSSLSVFGTVKYIKEENTGCLELKFETGSLPLFFYFYLSLFGIVCSLLIMIVYDKIELFVLFMVGLVSFILTLITIVNYFTSLKHKTNLERIIDCQFQ